MGALLFLVGGLLASLPAGAVVMPGTASHGCGLSQGDGMGGFMRVPSLFDETLNDPAFANANPATPVTVESFAGGAWPLSNPSSGSFTCTASAFNQGPGAEVDISFNGFGLPNAKIDAFATVSVDFQLVATQAGGPGMVPFSILLRTATDFFFGLGTGANMFTSARFTPPSGIGLSGFNDAFSAFNGVDPCPTGCGNLAFQNGMADPTQVYTYELQLFASLTSVTLAPPMGAIAEAHVFIDPIISIDPNLEFAPGQKYADYFEVVVSPNVTQAIPEPATASLLLLGLAALGRGAGGRRRL